MKLSLSFFLLALAGLLQQSTCANNETAVVVVSNDCSSSFTTQIVQQDGICYTEYCDCSSSGDLYNCQYYEFSSATSLDYLFMTCPQSLPCPSSSWTYINNNCSCPYCTCSASQLNNVTYYAYNFDNVVKFCYEYVCLSVFGGYYWASEAISFAIFDESNDFQCPSLTCTDGYSILSVGETTQSENSTGGCEYCSCISENNLQCASSIASLVSKPDLLAALKSDCYYSNLLPCWSDSSSWLLTSCYECPSCPCVNETKYYSSYNENTTQYSCYKCSCSYGQYECDDIADSFESFDCPPLECATSFSDGLTSSSEYCAGGDQGTYCDVSIGFNLDTNKSVSDLATSYGCQSSWLCSELNGKVGCYNSTKSYTLSEIDSCYTTNFTYTNYTIQPSGLIQCCDSGNKCNSDMVLDGWSPSCVNIPYAESFFGTFYECAYDVENLKANDSLIARALYCDASPNQFNFDICDYFNNLFGYMLSCYCKAYSAIYTYPGVSSTVKNGVSSDVQNTLDEANYLNIEFICDMTWSCDLSTGSTSVDVITYYVTFDLMITNVAYSTGHFNASSETAIISFVAGVTGVSSSDITITNSVTSSSGVTVSFKFEFNSEASATSFRNSLKSDSYNFGSTSTVDTGSISNVQSESSTSEGIRCHIGLYHNLILICVALFAWMVM